MNETRTLPFDDFPINHILISRMKTLLSSNSVHSVKRIPIGRPAMCYWNAEDNAIHHGGKVVMGWMIEWVPGLFIQAMDHAVFQAKNGGMADVTPVQSPRENDTGFTTFIVNKRRKFPHSFELTPPNIFLPLTDDPLVAEYISLYHENHYAHCKRVEALISSGSYSFHRGEIKRDSAHLEEKYVIEHDKYNESVIETSRKRKIISSELIKNYFS